MTELIAFKIYRTETIKVGGETFTVRFTYRTDGEEYALFASNTDNTKRWKCFYSTQVADDFNELKGESLASEVLKVLKGDIEFGLL